MRTDLLDPATATAGQVAALHEIETGALAVDEPDHPLPALADTEALLQEDRPDQDARHRLVTDGAAPVARAWLGLPTKHNTHTSFLHLVVLPAYRRRGIGTALLRDAVADLVAAGRRSILIEADTGTPGAAFCDAYGMEEAQADRSSKLRLADVDRDRVAEWAAAAHPGYRLVSWTGRCPDDLVASYGRAKQAMNDAPTGTMDWSPIEYGEQYVRDEEQTLLSRHRPFFVVAAVHEQTGDVAGFTELAVSEHSPARAQTEDTAVVPAHRGSGLGLWIKAELVRRLLAERPEVVEVVTRNGLTNDHMWRINELLGFRTYATVVERQGKVADLAARLGLPAPTSPDQVRSPDQARSAGSPD